MNTNEILRLIIAHAEDISVIQRASKELRRPEHNPDSLWRLYRYAMQDPGAEYPPEVRAAMEAFDKKMVQALPENRTVTVRFRCTENERNIMQLLADREGKSLSEFIRDRCLKD